MEPTKDSKNTTKTTTKTTMTEPSTSVETVDKDATVVTGHRSNEPTQET